MDRGSRKRRSSSIVYHEPPESIEQLSDQAALPNLNAEWVNAKGAQYPTILSISKVGKISSSILYPSVPVLREIAIQEEGKEDYQLCMSRRFRFLHPRRQQQSSSSHTATQLTHPTPTGAWLIHPILIFSLKILYDIIPGISQETSWTLTNLTYVAGSYLMFHWVRGIPFDFNSGAYDNLNMWEQIDDGDQYTPTKKYLLSVPIVLFLVSTHYTHYDLSTFCINLAATVAVTIPKLPALHRLRTRFLSGAPEDR
ncbi:ORMDL-domain-containing protein [Tothia fuscella]|uniref:ORMDL-domain-containing protein n=1 Tax=Tothia fuscella TaxID=1048955 RepID=A0A9P4P3A7_9PEZI|nr:ORMDL-domain-containing protein [Tothia fuscella]